MTRPQLWSYRSRGIGALLQSEILLITLSNSGYYGTDIPDPGFAGDTGSVVNQGVRGSRTAPASEYQIIVYGDNTGFLIFIRQI